MKYPLTVDRADETGIALISALLLTLLLSMIGASLVVVARSETLSTLNYKSMSQGRYAAESGVHAATNYLLYTYVPPITAAELANFNANVTPVTLANGNPVILSSEPSMASNYPVAAVQTAFAAASAGALDVRNGTAGYTAYARLLSLRQIIDPYSGAPITLESWEITGVGTLPGAGSANVEVSAVLERQVVPTFNYAAFSTDDGCGSLSFAGGASTNSYDSTAPLGPGGTPTISNSGGNVGSNGNLSEVGNPTTIWGTLSTPRAGVGECTSNNVTAATIAGNATVAGGLVELPQEVTFPTPAAPNPAPPTTDDRFNGGACPALTMTCAVAGNIYSIGPAAGQTSVTMGNLEVQGGSTLRLQAGTYIVNSIDMSGNSSIVVESGPVIFQVAGSGQVRPIDLTGGTVVNSTYDPMDLQFVYAGTGEVRLNGGAAAAALIYAPNANTALSGGTDFYGAIITGMLTATGGASIHYDRHLGSTGPMTAGSYTMNSFNWKTF